MSASAHRIIVVALFSGFFLLGILIYTDYGISWDETFHRYIGAVSAFYVNELFSLIPATDVLEFGNRTVPVPDLEGFAYKDYGVFFEMILVGCEYFFDVTDSRQVYFLRHYATFLVYFFGVTFFYLTIKRVFSSRMLAILGCVMLVVSPRIFAHGFYDLKDIAPLTLAITSIYTLIRLLEERTLTMAALHAFSIALFIDTRVVGIFLPVVTLFFLSIEFFKVYAHKGSLRELRTILLMFLFCLFFFIYLFWPYLWEDPIRRFWGAIVGMSHYGVAQDFDLEMLYFGDFIWSRSVPWHYLPVWIGITTPIVYWALALIGAITMTFQLIMRPQKVLEEGRARFGLLILIMFFGPIITVIVVKSTLLDGWRHMYFCYPALVLLAIMGLVSVSKLTVEGVRSLKVRFVQYVTGFALVLSIVSTVANMYINHPHQYAYFNVLAGNDIARNWELDYWGSSFRQGLERVLAIDDSPNINISFSALTPGEGNLSIMKGEDRERLNIVEESQAKYHLSNYRFKKDYGRFHANQTPFDKEVYSIEVSSILDRYKIMGIYAVD